MVEATLNPTEITHYDWQRSSPEPARSLLNGNPSPRQCHPSPRRCDAASAAAPPHPDHLSPSSLHRKPICIDKTDPTSTPPRPGKRASRPLDQPEWEYMKDRRSIGRKKASDGYRRWSRERCLLGHRLVACQQSYMGHVTRGIVVKAVFSYWANEPCK